MARRGRGPGSVRGRSNLGEAEPDAEPAEAARKRIAASLRCLIPLSACHGFMCFSFRCLVHVQTPGARFAIAIRAYGFITTLMQPSCLSRKVLYIAGPLERRPCA